MSGRIAFAVASATLLWAGMPAPAQSPGPALPRVIYGTDQPAVIYGPPSEPPEAPAPRQPPAPAPAVPEAPPPSSPGTTITHGWMPAGPPVWERPGNRPRPVPPIAPPRDSRFEPPLPMGTYLGRPPSAALPGSPPPPRTRR